MMIKVVIIIIVFFTILIYYYKYVTNKNYKRHLTYEFGYAHFSEIHKYNFFLYPSLLLTHPQRFILETNDALWIPKGWWHWIESFDTVSINFWLTDIKNKEEYENPFTSKEILSKNILNEINNYNKKVVIWQSSNDNVYKEYSKNLNENEMIITLPGYMNGFKKDKMNLELMKKIEPYIKTPLLLEKIKDSEIDHNLWISNKFHDTGLHYDDNYGLLCVLKGKKYITLYPPCDTPYLRPLSILPFWATNKPIKFVYNTYTFVKDLDEKVSLPSSRLLYETLKHYNNKDIMLIISDKLKRYGVNKIIWGFKLNFIQSDLPNEPRWELYACHYSSKDKSISSILDFADFTNYKNYDKLKLMKKENENIFIHSFDLYNKGIIGKDIHFYYKKNKTYDLPFFGYSNTLKEDGEINSESDFVIDTSTRFIKNYDNYMEKINYDINKVLSLKNLLLKYDCTYYCIHKKNSKQIYIQYLDISLGSFFLFLEKFNYPLSLINHIKSNINKYKDINHEITIVYDIETGEPIRSAFYGLV